MSADVQKALSDDRKGTLAVFVILSLFAIGWWFAYGKPHQEFLLAVGECTGNDASKTAWEKCVKIVQAEP
jgi:hypothetical protein